MSWHKGGMTERIANAMLAGSICVTDTTSYLKKHFTDGKDIVFFSLEDIYSLPQKIKNLLADMDTASKIAANGKENALKQVDETVSEVKRELKETQKEIAKQREDMKFQHGFRKFLFWATPILLLAQTIAIIISAI